MLDNAPNVTEHSVPADRTARMQGARTSVAGLGAGFVLLFIVLPLEHTPAARALLCSLLGLIGFAHLFVAGDTGLARRGWPLGLWLLWSGFSYYWSVDPEATLAALKHDLWLPALAGVGAYALFRRLNLPDLLVWAAAAGTLANAFVVMFGAPKAPWPLTVAQYYVSTVAYASTSALCFAALALPWLADWQRPRMRVLSAIVILMNVGVGVMLESRALLFAIILLLVLLSIIMLLRGARRSPLVLAAAVLVVATVLLAVNRDRTEWLTGSTEVSAGLAHVLNREVRFALWQHWVPHIANASPLGVGFGRELPATTLSPEQRSTLLAIDVFGAMHPHNLFLAVLAETGWPGLVLFVGMLAWVVRHFLRAVRHVDETSARAGMAGLFLVMAVILKNQTDVLLVFGPAALFYAALGALLAWPHENKSSS